MSVARLVFLQGLAMAASLFGYLLISPAFYRSIDAKDVGLGGGFALLTIAATYGWWPAAITAAATGIRGAYLGLVILDVVWVLLGQGVAGLAFCALPFCPDFAPYSDVARYSSLVTGAVAAWTAWRAYRAAPGPTQWSVPATAIVLTVLSFVFQALYAKY